MAYRAYAIRPYILRITQSGMAVCNVVHAAAYRTYGIRPYILRITQSGMAVCNVVHAAA